MNIIAATAITATFRIN